MYIYIHLCIHINVFIYKYLTYSWQCVIEMALQRFVWILFKFYVGWEKESMCHFIGFTLWLYTTFTLHIYMHRALYNTNKNFCDVPFFQNVYYVNKREKKRQKNEWKIVVGINTSNFVCMHVYVNACIVIKKNQVVPT